MFALMIMELSWVVPWYRSLTPATNAVSSWKVFLVFFVFLLVANLSTRLMNYLDIKLAIRRGISLGLIVLCVFLGLRLLLYEAEPLSFDELVNRPFRAFSDIGGLIPDEFLVLVLVLIVFWRGLSLATKFIDPVSVRQNFYLGLGMYTAYIFVNTIVTGETPGFLLYLFFVSALIALGAARIFTITQLRGGTDNPFDLRWFLGIFFTTLVIVGLAAFIAWLFSDRTNLLSVIGGLFLGLFGLLTLLIISPVIFILERFGSVLPQDSGAFRNLVSALEDLRNTFGNLANNFLSLIDIPSLANWMQLIKPILLWTFVILIVAAILFSISRWFLRERYSKVDERESIIERGDILKMIRQAIQKRLDELSQSLSRRRNLRASQRWLAAAKIRRIYSRLMDLAEKLGEPRPPAFTPLEFLPVLEDILPERQDEIDLITQAYLGIRYGELPETNREVELVEDAWDRVNTLGKEKYAAMKKTQR